MAPRKQWGKTPWGGAFLQALESIDVGGGRLKRGKTIANTNKVLNFQVRQGQVTSRVQGSFQPYYNIRINFPQLSEDHKRAILNIIRANPIHLGAILNGELPLQLLDIIEQQASVRLLPHQWSDFMGDCTCPDYSSGQGYYNGAPRPAGCPCKHMSGTFYVICGEMDKDPFAIFKLRGLDLLQELAILSNDDEKENAAIPYPLKVEAFSATKQDDPQDTLVLKDIRSCSGFVLSCLGPNPPFSRHVDFHAALRECYTHLQNSKKMTKTSLALLNGKNVDIEQLEELLPFSHMSLHVNQDNMVASVHVENDMFDANVVKEAFEEVEHQFVEPSTVVLSKTTIVSLLPLMSAPPNGGSHFGFFWWAVRLARLLVKKGAIVPDLLPGDGDSWIGIWRPLATNIDVAAAMDALANMHPAFDPCVLLNKSPLSTQCAVEHLLTTLCTTLVHEAGFMQKERRVSPPKESKAFFRGETFYVEHASERSMASAIHRYFSVFSLMSSDFELELQVTGNPPNDYRVKLLFDGEPLCDFLENIKGEPKKHAAALKLLTQLVAPQLSDTVQALLQSRDAPLSCADLQKFLLGASSTMRALGVRTIVPKELSRVIKPRLVLAPKEIDDLVSAGDAASNAKSVLSKLALVQFEWRIAIGDDTLSPEEFQKLTQNQAKGVVHFKHNFVELDATEINHIMAAATKDATQPSSTDILHAALLSTDKGPVDNVWLPTSAREIIRSGAGNSNAFNVPESLNAELRPYQLQGFRWMMGLIENGFGAILADDMGLGKTIQTLTMLLQLQENNHFQDVGPALIVVPTALLYNWQRETKRFAESLRIRVYHGADRSLPAGCTSPRSSDSAPAKRSKSEPCQVDIVLTTYGTVRSDVAKLKKVGWGAVIIDEAQQIKNVASSQTKAIKQLNAPVKLALSGTPVENKLSELWSIFDFVLPGFLGTIKQFKKAYSKPIEADNDEEALVKLRMLTGPFLLRRLKTDPEIGKELPEKLVTDHVCSLGKEQAALYQTVVDDVAEELARQKEGKGSGRSAVVLKMIGDLKQICNHPHNFSPNKYSPDANLSGKCELMSELIEPILKNGEQLLIFTQYVTMLSSLVDHIIPEKHNVKPLAYHGGMSVAARDTAVKRFQNGDVPIMVVSLKAGGVGLNLTAANHVCMFDLWWNPAVEQQAIDRCYRIGQRRNVFVHRFITHGTFEVKINEMIARKRELSDLSVAKGEQWLSDLSNDELISLLRGNEESEVGE